MNTMARIVDFYRFAKFHNIQELKLNGLWPGEEGKCKI